MQIMDRYHALVKVLFVAVIMTVTASPAAAQIVVWRTILGIEQPGNIVGSFTTPPTCTNGAGCFNGGGQPWTTFTPLQLLPGQAQFATVNLSTGQLQFEVHGLVLAGGNSIGTVGPLTSVIGTIICIVGPSANVIYNTVPVT